MAVTKLQLSVLFLVMAVPYLTSSTSIQMSDLSAEVQAEIQKYNNQPDCPEEPVRPRPAVQNGATANTAASGRTGARTGARIGPSHIEPKNTFVVKVPGGCCKEVIHDSCTGCKYTLVISKIRGIEPKGLASFYDYDLNSLDKTRIIVLTEEILSELTDPPILERSETDTVLARFCASGGANARFEYSLIPMQ